MSSFTASARCRMRVCSRSPSAGDGDRTPIICCCCVGCAACGSFSPSAAPCGGVESVSCAFCGVSVVVAAAAAAAAAASAITSFDSSVPSFDPTGSCGVSAAVSSSDPSVSCGASGTSSSSSCVSCWGSGVSVSASAATTRVSPGVPGDAGVCAGGVAGQHGSLSAASRHAVCDALWHRMHW